MWGVGCSIFQEDISLLNANVIEPHWVELKLWREEDTETACWKEVFVFISMGPLKGKHWKYLETSLVLLLEKTIRQAEVLIL